MSARIRVFAATAALAAVGCQDTSPAAGGQADAAGQRQADGGVDAGVERQADAAPAAPIVFAVTASGHDGNVPENTLDGSFDTRWSAEGDGVWIQYQLRESTIVGRVDIAWYRGDRRQSFFDVQLGPDPSELTTVGRFASSGDTTGFASFDFPDATATYIRIVGRGNSQPGNEWTSITEFRSRGPGGDGGAGGVDAGPGDVDGGAGSVDSGPDVDGGGGTGTVHDVANETEFDNALAMAGPGDTIRLTASIDELSLRDLDYPASNPLRVVAGAGVSLQQFSITDSRGVRVEGFRLSSAESSTLFKVVNSTDLAIIGNVFDCGAMTAEGQSAIVTTHASADIEIAYNEFKNIAFSGTNSGSFIKTQYDAPQITARLHIHHNYFHDIEPVVIGGTFDGDSDREAIVFGIADAQDIATNHIVEHNLFEDCDGENEIITVKTSNNTIRYNTFVNNLGSVSIRFGAGTDVHGNFFFANSLNQNPFPDDTGGIRVYGHGHRIFNNYFEGLTGRGFRVPINIDGGDTSDSSGGDGHERPTDVEVVNNTLVDCAHGIGVGTHYSLAPQRTVFANNLVYNTANPMFEIARESGSIYQRNIGFGSAPGRAFTTDELWVVDPALVDAGPVFRLSPSSPAVGHGLDYAYVTDDMDGQARTATDVGADQLSSAPVTRSPLTPADVGPAARAP